MKRGRLRRFSRTVLIVESVLMAAVLIRSQALAHRTPRLEAAKKAEIPKRALGKHAPRARTSLAKAYGQLPLSFEPNQGQEDSTVRYVSHGAGYTLFLTHDEAVFTVDGQDETDRILQNMDPHQRKKFEATKFYRVSPRFHRHGKSGTVRMAMDGASPSTSTIPLGQLPGKTNYFIGRNPAQWHTGIPTYREVKYSGIYPGTDLLYYGKQGHLEFDFVLRPNANPKDIRLHFDGPGPLALDAGGDLKFATDGRSFELLHPNVYQVRDGKRIPVQGHFVLLANNRVGIEIGKYDRSTLLVVDPVLTYSTYLGGSGTDFADGIAVDAQGDAYVTGQATSTDFPTYNGYSSSGNANGIAFVTVFDPTGTTLLYSTYLGGSGGDWATGVAVDSLGGVYLTGLTVSTDFPVVNAFQNSLPSANGSAFVARIDTTQSGVASLGFSTYLGGGGNSSNSLGDIGFAIATDQTGTAYVTGQTASDSSRGTPFPTTPSALQSSLASVNGNAFLSVLNTIQGGPTALIYSTYLGGASASWGDYGQGIAVDAVGNAYITGQTISDASGPFPTTSGAYQTTLNSAYGNVFVTEINTQQSGSQSLVYSTYLGGSANFGIGDLGSGIGLDATGRIYVGGDATSSDFPVTAGAYQITNSPAGKAFVALFDPTKTGTQSLVYSTFLGGTNGGEGEVINGLAVDDNDNAVVAGSTSSSDFPTTADAFQTGLKNPSWNAFLTKLNPSGTELIYSTYFGGSCTNGLGDSGNGIALDSIGNPYLAGTTCSTDLPVAPTNAYQSTLKGSYNGFIARFVWNPNPAITASLIPSPNASGWNNSPVTVLFTCTPGPAPIQGCSPPFVVRTEGANQAESGTVTDIQGNSASTTATVNLDITPPVITITSPIDGSSVSTGTLTVMGTIADNGSGPGTVNCHGASASLSGSSFSCNVYLAAGANSIAVVGTDLAGNASSASLSVTNTGVSGQTSPPTISGISPSQGGIGNTVTLTGGGFGASQGTSIVAFNGIPAQPLSWTDSRVSVSVPDGLNPGIATTSVGVNGSLSNTVPFTVTSPIFISPSQITLAVGNTQPIELRDGNGVSISGATWTFSNPAIAQIIPPVNDQPTLVQGNSVGMTTLIAAYANQTGTATITVLPGGSPLPSNGVVWSVPSLGGEISKIISATPSQGGPALYAEDDGAYGGNGAIRAIDANGQQLSIWPASSSSDAFPLLVGGDNQGGALYFANQDNPNQFQSYCYFGRVDQSGNETWEYQESNCYEDTAVGPDGTIYLLEDDFQNSGNNVLTALDPTSGSIKFTVLLPGFDTSNGGADWTSMPEPGDWNGQPPPYQPYCTPGTTVPGGPTSTNAQSFEHGNMSIGADGTIYIPLTGGTTFFEGEPCDSTPDPNNPGYTYPVNFANNSQGSFTDTRTLYLMAVGADGSYTIQTIDSQTFSGPGWDGAPQYNVFLHRGAPDGQGGFVLPIEQILYHTGGTNVSLPFSVAGFDPDLALGSDGTTYISARGVLSAVNGGAVTWTYQPPQGNLNISSVLEGGGLAVSNDQLGPVLLDPAGNATSAGFPGSRISLASSWNDAWYADNLPGAGGGVSSLTLPASVDPDSFWLGPQGDSASSEMATPMCGCDVQTADTASDPPSIPINSLTSPELGGGPFCTTLAGGGSTDLILVGDPGLGQHDVRSLFNLAAQQKANDLNGAGDNVIACRISSANDMGFALVGELPGEGLVGQITGQAFYFGHSGPFSHLNNQGVKDGIESILAAGQNAATPTNPYPNVDAQDVYEMLKGVRTAYKGKNILSDATSLWIFGCAPAEVVFDYFANNYISIAQLVSNVVQHGVYAWDVGVYFSHKNVNDENVKNRTGVVDPNLPIYMVPIGGPPKKPMIGLTPR